MAWELSREQALKRSLQYIIGTDDDVDSLLTSDGDVDIAKFRAFIQSLFDKVECRESPPLTGRLGPQSVHMSTVYGNTQDEGEFGILSPTSFATLRSNCSVVSGKWMYEVTLRTRGLIQLGWTTLIAKYTREEGVGDTCDSFAYDGYRCCVWNVLRKAYGEYWSVGDIIGCALDLEEGTISYHRNGRNLGVAFVEIPRKERNAGYFAGASLSAGQGCEFNFNSRPFAYPIHGYAPLQASPQTYKEIKQAQLAMDIVQRVTSATRGGELRYADALLLTNVLSGHLQSICYSAHLVEAAFLPKLIPMVKSVSSYANGPLALLFRLITSNLEMDDICELSCSMVTYFSNKVRSHVSTMNQLNSGRNSAAESIQCLRVLFEQCPLLIRCWHKRIGTCICRFHDLFSLKLPTSPKDLADASSQILENLDAGDSQFFLKLSLARNEKLRSQTLMVHEVQASLLRCLHSFEAGVLDTMIDWTSEAFADAHIERPKPRLYNSTMPVMFVRAYLKMSPMLNGFKNSFTMNFSNLNRLHSVIAGRVSESQGRLGGTLSHLEREVALPCRLFRQSYSITSWEEGGMSSLGRQTVCHRESLESEKYILHYVLPKLLYICSNSLSAEVKHISSSFRLLQEQMDALNKLGSTCASEPCWNTTSPNFRKYIGMRNKLEYLLLHHINSRNLVDLHLDEKSDRTWDMFLSMASITARQLIALLSVGEKGEAYHLASYFHEPITLAALQIGVAPLFSKFSDCESVENDGSCSVRMMNGDMHCILLMALMLLADDRVIAPNVKTSSLGALGAYLRVAAVDVRYRTCIFHQPTLRMYLGRACVKMLASPRDLDTTCSLLGEYFELWRSPGKVPNHQKTGFQNKLSSVMMEATRLDTALLRTFIRRIFGHATGILSVIIPNLKALAELQYGAPSYAMERVQIDFSICAFLLNLLDVWMRGYADAFTSNTLGADIHASLLADLMLYLLPQFDPGSALMTSLRKLQWTGEDSKAFGQVFSSDRFAVPSMRLCLAMYHADTAAGVRFTEEKGALIPPGKSSCILTMCSAAAGGSVHKLLSHVERLAIEISNSEYCSALAFIGSSDLVDLFLSIDCCEGFYARSRAAGEAEEEEEIPAEYIDPIMMSIMTDPVVLPSSKTVVDRHTIKRHLLSNDTDPFNREPLKIGEVVPAEELRKKIKEWKEKMSG